MTIIVGLDLSLTSSGMAIVSTESTLIQRVESSGSADASLTERHHRLLEVRRRVIAKVPVYTDIVCIEGPSHGSPKQRGTFDRNGFWWLVIHELDRLHVPVVEIPPATVKKFATGNGAASKEAMLVAAVRRFPSVDVNTNDEADALWLAAIGAEHLDAPIVEVPQTHRAFLNKIRWPT